MRPPKPTETKITQVHFFSSTPKEKPSKSWLKSIKKWLQGQESASSNTSSTQEKQEKKISFEGIQWEESTRPGETEGRFFAKGEYLGQSFEVNIARTQLDKDKWSWWMTSPFLLTTKYEKGILRGGSYASREVAARDFVTSEKHGYTLFKQLVDKASQK